jgi:CheY-like chemotaxis protein
LFFSRAKHPALANLYFYKVKKKILIADDDADILFVLKMMLELKGYEVELASEGDKVITLITNKPDLILLDIWMGNYDGREICQQLKNNPATSGIPIILISASREIEQSAKDAGANDFVAKPFEQHDLLEKIGQYI